MLTSKSRRVFAFSAAVVAAAFAIIAVSVESAQAATTGYGSASTITRGGFDPAVLGETDSSSVVVAGRDRSVRDGNSASMVANEASSNSIGASSNATNIISSTSTSTKSTVNGVPVVGRISTTVNGVPATIQNVTASGGNSTSVSFSTSTRCSSSSGCTIITSTGSPSAAAVSQIVEERKSSGAGSGEDVPSPVLTPTPVSIAPSTSETTALLPDAVRAVAL